jgi:hypothetical protein
MDNIRVHPLEGESLGSSEACKPTSCKVDDGNATILMALTRGSGDLEPTLHKVFDPSDIT